MLTATEERIDIRGYPQQMDFIRTSNAEAAFVAGLGSGKSHAGAQKALAYCLANPGAWGIVTAPQNRILEIATIPTYEKVFPASFARKKRMRPFPEWELINGCRIFFWSTDKPETISGAELAWAHMDEGSLSPYLAYMNIKKRLRQRDKDGKPFPHQLWITTTPRQLNWLYKEVTKESSHIQLIGASTRDNIYLENVEEYIDRMGLVGKEYEQDIEGKFVLLAGDCLFSQEILDMQLVNCEPPIDVIDNGIFKTTSRGRRIELPKTEIWQEPIFGVKYIAAADCADEGGEGVNSLVIVDSQLGTPVAEINADIPADKFAELCFKLLGKYYNPLFAPERNGVGNIVVQKLKDMGYENLYKDDKDKAGWFTSTRAFPPKVSREQMLREFEEAVRLRQWVEKSTDAIGEMSTFVRNEKGSFVHRQGCRDDRLMARAICWQMKKHIAEGTASFQVFKRHSTSYN